MRRMDGLTWVCCASEPGSQPCFTSKTESNWMRGPLSLVTAGVSSAGKSGEAVFHRAIDLEREGIAALAPCRLPACLDMFGQNS
jgi:hypothetical protein